MGRLTYDNGTIDGRVGEGGRYKRAAGTCGINSIASERILGSLRPCRGERAARDATRGAHIRAAPRTCTAASMLAGEEMFGSLSMAMTETMICSTPRIGRQRSSADSCGDARARAAGAREGGRGEGCKPRSGAGDYGAAAVPVARRARRSGTHERVKNVDAGRVQDRDADLAVGVD